MRERIQKIAQDRAIAGLFLKAAKRRAATRKPRTDKNNDGWTDGQRPKGAKPRKVVKPLDDTDPSSPNYRYRDTGYVAGSRKEKAAEQIRAAKRNGHRLRVTDIDWAEIEQNPREAEALITKSNLFGKVDWKALREGGMEPGAGFLIDRIYASVGSEPSESSPAARRDFALGLQTLRDRLETCKTPNQVTDVLNEIRDEIRGEMIGARNSERYQKAYAAYEAARDRQAESDREWDVVWRPHSNATSKLSAAKYAQQKRLNRRWKPDPAIAAEIAAAEAEVARTQAAVDAWQQANPREARDALRRDRENAWRESQKVLAEEQSAAVFDNSLTRAWATLGKRFVGVVQYRSGRGSAAFGAHVTTAKSGKITDWDWADGDGPMKPAKERKESVGFQLKVAESFERVGGRAIPMDSTAALKQHFNLREVQSGNWVLRDVRSAQWHTQQSAEALADLADVIGASDADVSLNGRLALAFGARGRGNAGFGGAAAAHYEPVHRIINITKMGGGGSLAHEWLHALDNIVADVQGGAGAKGYAIETPDIVKDPDLRKAFTRVRDAMLQGTVRTPEIIEYDARDVGTAAYNIDARVPGTVARKIKAAGNAAAAVIAVREHFAPVLSSRRNRIMMGRWVKLAAAYHDKNPSGAKLTLETGEPRSQFAYEAVRLDNGVQQKYWSQPREMGARAFQAYVEDRLAGMGRKSDYLSVYADNKFYANSLFGPQFPFPEGAERERINAAFDELFAVMREKQTLRKMAAHLDRADAIRSRR